MTAQQDSGPVFEPVMADGQTAMVRAYAIRCIDELIRELGGDPEQIFARVQLDPGVLANRHAIFPHRTLVHLLERAAVELNCKDFGMRLALIQGAAKVLGGPLEIAMRNSRTLGDAFRYCADHVQAYGTAAQIILDKDRSSQSLFMRFEVMLSRLPYQRQALEHALLLVQNNFFKLSGGRARAHEVWFTHEPCAPLATYRGHFGCPVHFGKSVNGLLFAQRDFELEIPESDPQLYDLATTYIDYHFPAKERVLSARVRTIVERLLLAGDCTFITVASTLGMHPRTLQRRLRAEGDSFEAIKDSVRRDVALRYLKQSDLPLIRVAEILGYSETSVLSRSCYRWFSASPRQLRSGKAEPASN